MRYLFSILFLLSYVVSMAQIYSNRELLGLGELLTKSKQRLNFVQENDVEGRIVHLGMPLFRMSVKENYNTPLYNFCERCNLRLRLLDNKSRYQYLSDNKIDVYCDDFFKVDSSCDFRIETLENNYVVTWLKDSVEVARMTFEKNFSLIFGLDVQESQAMFKTELLDTSIVCNIPVRDSFMAEDSLFLVSKGDSYMIESMKSDLYFSKADSLPICSSEYPIQTLYNIFGGLVKSNAILNVSQNLYGYKKAFYKVSFDRFVRFCLSQNCNFYLGIEDHSDHKIKATVIYENKDFGYNHLVFLNGIDDSFFDTDMPEINCELNTYIPVHNLKDLYNELSSNKK